MPDLAAAEQEAIKVAPGDGGTAQKVRAGKILDLSSRLEIVDADGKLPASVVTFRPLSPTQRRLGGSVQVCARRGR